MYAKEQGWVLSIDQASNAAGVSLWYNGALRATTVLRSDKKSDSIARRLQTQVPQLTSFLKGNLPEGDRIRCVLFEAVRARLVLITVGAFLTCPLIDSHISPTRNFVPSSSWKSWARRHGATEPKIADIKGVKALRESGFPVEQFAVTSDDVADSILIYLTWRDAG